MCIGWLGTRMHVDRDRRGSAAPSLRPDLLRDTRFADIALRPSKSTEQSTLLALYTRAWAVHLSLSPFSATLPHLSRFSFFFPLHSTSPIPTVRPLVSRILFYSSGYSCIHPFTLRPSSSFQPFPLIRSYNVRLFLFVSHPLSFSFSTTLFDRVISRYYSPVFG